MRPHIGIIGAGNIGTAHGKAIHYLQKTGLIDADLVGVCDPDEAKRTAFAEAARLSFATADPSELIASPDVNTVYVCTPTVFHKQAALAALAAGKALFCEKPLAFNARDAAEVRDAARKAGVTHQVGLVMRFSPVMNVSRALLADPALGRVMTAVMVDDQFFPIQGHYRSTWRGDVRLAGAGTLLEHAIHDVDVLVWFFGPVKRVYGVTRHFFEKEGVEDLSSEILEFESGAVVNHVSIWHNLLRRGSSRRLSVICQDGQFAWEDDDWAGAIRIETNESAGRREITSEEVIARYVEGAALPDEVRQLMAPTYRGLDYTMENYRFLQAVSEGRAGSPGFDEAVYAHRVVDAIYESARSGRPVDLA